MYYAIRTSNDKSEFAVSCLISLTYSRFTCVPFSALLAPTTFYACVPSHPIPSFTLNFVVFILFLFSLDSFFNFFLFVAKFNMLWLMSFSVLRSVFFFFFLFIYFFVVVAYFQIDVPDNLGLYGNSNENRVPVAIIRLYQ